MSVTFKQTVLPNGLTVIAECDDDAHSAAVGYFVRTGARDEDASVMGVSHFLEHMMFKGTPTRTTEEINQAFDKIGARNNAYTTHEMTCFHATVLPERLLGKGGANEVLADMMRPALRQADFDTEKNVILEEIAMYQDNPFWVLYERALEEHCSGLAPTGERTVHPLGHRVLGTKQTISALESGQMRGYFENRYSADNTVVALAGKLDFARAVEEIEAQCGAWARTGAERVQSSPPVADREMILRDRKVNRAYLMVFSGAPGATDPRRYAASLLAAVLGGPDNSRFHWSLIETGIAEQAESAYDPRDGVGDLMMYVSCDPSRREEVWRIIDEQTRTLADTLTADDLDKIRCKAATGVTLAGERPGGRMQRLGRQWTYHRAYTTLEEELENINRVTVEDVRQVLEAFPPTPRTVAWLLPEDGGPGAAR